MEHIRRCGAEQRQHDTFDAYRVLVWCGVGAEQGDRPTDQGAVRDGIRWPVVSGELGVGVEIDLPTEYVGVEHERVASGTWKQHVQNWSRHARSSLPAGRGRQPVSILLLAGDTSVSITVRRGPLVPFTTERYGSPMMSDDSGEIAVSRETTWAFDRSRFIDGEVDAAMIALDRAGIGVVVIDADFRFVFANDVAAAINGYRADEHIGASMYDILSGTAEAVAPMLREVMRSGVPVLGQEIFGETHARPGELRVWTGDYLPYRVSGADSMGLANAVLIVFSEVTETRRAERRLRQVIDGLFTFVGLCDVDGTLLEANEFALVAAALEPTDVIGRPFWDCYWWSHDAGVRRLVRDAVTQAAGGSRCRFDVSVRLAGGRIVPIDFQLVPVIEHGRVISLVPSGIDIEAVRTRSGTWQN